jgi:hypothetical protein
MQQLDVKIEDTNFLMIPYTRSNVFLHDLQLIFEVKEPYFYTVHWVVVYGVFCHIQSPQL